MQSINTVTQLISKHSHQSTETNTQRQTGMYIVVLGGADLTSTSYVYSSLVVHDPGRVAARAPVHPPILHLGVRHIELTDHVALVGLIMAQVVVAVFDDGVVVQRPGAPGGRRAFDIANQEDGLVWVHHLLTEGGQDLWSTICGGRQGGTEQGTVRHKQVLTVF